MRSLQYLAILCCQSATIVAAHGYLSQPSATYIDQRTKTGYVARVDGNQMFGGLKWDDSPSANSDQLTQKINDGSMPDLKTFFANNYATGCPKNNLDVSIQVSGLSSFKWQNDQEQKGFIDSHEGPCEVWIDSTKVFSDTDCARKYKSYPAEIPIKYNACSGTCKFEFYWLALHEPMWQLYKACATIVNNPSPSASISPSPTQSSSQNSSCGTPTPTPCSLPIKEY